MQNRTGDTVDSATGAPIPRSVGEARRGRPALVLGLLIVALWAALFLAGALIARAYGLSALAQAGPWLLEAGLVASLLGACALLGGRAALSRAAPVLQAVVGGMLALVFFLDFGRLGFYSVPFIVQTLPTGVPYAELSVELTTLSFAIGFVLALPIAIVRSFPPTWSSDQPSPSAGSGRGVLPSVRRAVRWPLYGLATAYVQAVRGTPFLVQAFIVFYAMLFALHRFVFLGEAAGFWAGLIALTINTTGYQAEALRGGFQSVDAAEVQGGQAIGLTKLQIFRRITFPQGIRLVTLPLTNEWISNFKTSTILSYIAVFELFTWSRTYVAYQLGRSVEAFLMLAIFYLAINVTLSRVVTYAESRWRIPGLGGPPAEFTTRAG